MSAYVAEEYWERLLSEQYSAAGVGYANLALAINLAMYGSLRTAVGRVLGDAPPGRVLDVGSGTGIWVDFWRERGATDIAGFDLTEAAVRNLRARFPDLRFERADVAGDALPFAGPFDTVSAMSVLLHVTDDDRYARAIGNLAGVVAPGGRLVMIEPLIAHRWWGPPLGPEASSRARPLAGVRELLAANGLGVEHVGPATILLSNPIDTRTRIGWRALSFYWDQLSARVGRDERRAAPFARAVGALDRALLRVVPSGPSAKVVVARRV